MKSAEIQLPYYKQGDDLHHCLDESKGDVRAALEIHAEILEEAAKQLRAIMLTIGEADEIKIDASTHYIGIMGPANLIDKLIEDELAVPCHNEYDDEDEDE